MKRDFFIKIENKEHDTSFDLDKIVEQLAFNEQGLIPVITQDAITKEVLMFAWMTKESLEKTLSSRYLCYWSRSRQELWTKGETSGHTQYLVSMAFDCDGDAILCQVDQNGSACHTGRRNCFYLELDHDKRRVIIQGDSA
ncbi:phosphoribosyl-AMP cyclohydrolase [Agaribacterium sp. ZY112]|uniref:phosphoribosyl-AMP cyclohydrolase n=1 Tax=Agaribacterium sp. ZY112 TaxID=3233574 RepID=UPI00352556DD